MEDSTLHIVNMAANFYGSPIRGTVAEVNIEDSLVGNESSVQQEVEV